MLYILSIDKSFIISVFGIYFSMFESQFYALVINVREIQCIKTTFLDARKITQLAEQKHKIEALDIVMLTKKKCEWCVKSDVVN